LHSFFKHRTKAIVISVAIQYCRETTQNGLTYGNRGGNEILDWFPQPLIWTSFFLGTPLRNTGLGQAWAKLTIDMWALQKHINSCLGQRLENIQLFPWVYLEIE
jgi:hypothetical protein